MKNTSGSCLCGVVRFEIRGDFERFFLCHCTYCQKDTGSAHAANLFSTTAKLSWLSGQHKVRTFTLPNTRHVKSFCNVCGSALPVCQNGGDLLVVPAGSLDQEVSERPDGHIYCARRASWDTCLQEITEFPLLPE